MALLREEMQEKIALIIETYHQRCKSADIDTLLYMSDKLAVWSTVLAETLADEEGSYLRAYFVRKCSFAEHKHRFMQDGETGVQAEQKAVIANKENREEEIIKEATMRKYRLLLRQVNKVLSSMQQRISFAKQEYSRMHALGDNTNQKK